MGDADIEITFDDTRRCRLLLLISKGGGLVLRHKLQKGFTRRQKTIDDTDIKRKITQIKDSTHCISEVQYKRIYPDSGSSSPDDYDITILVFLLRTLFYRTSDPKWKSGYTLNDTDISDIAEIVRIRELRNEVKHQYEDGELNETTFNDQWRKCEKVLVRFGRTDIADLSNKLEKFKSEPIEKKSLEDLIEQWEKLDEDMENRVIETIKQHSARVNARERSEKEVSDVLEAQYFVETSMFEQAKQKLNKDGFIVIEGAQGEGKTTMGKKLVENPKKCLKINSVADWEMYSSTDDIETVLIDDMFGCTMFDKSESRKWLKIFPQLMSEVSRQKLKLIITSRTYILDDAQKKLFIEHHIKKRNRIEISSEKLECHEKKQIIKNHLELNGRKFGKNLIDSCVRQLNEPSSFIIGFPECARLFGVQDSLFHKGSSFFKAPMTHIKTCLDTIFKNKDDFVFLAFFVLWSQPSQSLRLSDLEQSPVKTPISIKRPIEHLGFSLFYSLRHIPNEFASHKNFVCFDDKTEIFRFQHNVVGDAVGLVAFVRNMTAALEFCNASFIERYIRIEEQSDTCEGNKNDEIVTIPINRYADLCSVIGKILLPDRTVSDTDIRNLRDHVCSVFGQTSPLKGNETDAEIRNMRDQICTIIDQMSFLQRTGSNDDQYMNCKIILHPAFKCRSFCETFLETLRKQNMLPYFLTKHVGTITASVLSITDILDKQDFESEIGVLTYAVNNSHSPHPYVFRR
ncbi:uncharacterized protein LOC132741809 [Ruditapes philippinarum]|uniref:uncharacterized protein LOC132741809 n=1 Tax=Ruditapes philippinarum TaxID=129788 RepID=UPI00295A88F8|nr:uncharacterized protein LOC132741809 [Ruditapes philippinarum]